MRWYRSLFIAAVAAVAIACDDSHSTGRVSGKDVRDSYGEAARTTNAYVSQTRDAYVDKAEKEMSEIDAELAKLRANAKAAAADARGQIDASIATLEAKRAQAASRLTDLKNATGDAWRDMAAGLDRALSDLHDSAKDAADRFD